MPSHVIGVNIAKGPTITLASGRIFDFLDPHGSDFAIEDIAHGLAHVCRYAGQCRDFYSVAEHSLLVSAIVDDFAYEALLHDAAEAFIGDITRPLKQLLPDFKSIEVNIEAAIAQRFELRPGYKDIVKVADLAVLAAEQLQIMAPGTADWAIAAGIVPADIQVRNLPPPVAKSAFLDRYSEVRPRR